MNTYNSLPAYCTIGLLLVGLVACTNQRPLGQVKDDVYDIAPPAPMAASSAPVDGGIEDEYFDPNEAQKFQDRGYYDMAYNDPYWYNYGRFGFGQTVSPFGSSMYSMGLGGSPYSPWSSWNDPFGNSMWGSWNDPFANNWSMWGHPCGPYYGGPSWGMAAGPYMGWGYYDAWGNCWGCYQPCAYSAPVNNTSAPVIVAPRRAPGQGTVAGGSGTSTPPAIAHPFTPSPRSPVSLRSAPPPPQRPSISAAPERNIKPPQVPNSDTWSSPSRSTPTPGGGGRVITPRR
jgi:hypothetical protein